MKVHSFHSFCVKTYDRKSYTDTVMKNIIQNKKPFSYGVIICDEI